MRLGRCAPIPLAAALAVSGPLALSSCGGTVISAGDVSVLVSEFPQGGMDAQGGGRLEIVGGCLGASGTVIVWPHRTRVVSRSPLTISVPGRGTFEMGDQVQVAGGTVLEDRSASAEPGPVEVGGVTVPTECARHDIFLAH